MWEILVLLVLAVAGWLFYEALRAREAAIHVTRDACKLHGLQLLDDTVQGVRLRLARDAEGVVRVRRSFVFDFSEDGVNRRGGSVVMLGGEVESMQLEPYRLQ